MKYLVLIQARVGSSRLPCKVLTDICGKTDLQWVIERVRRSRLVDEVMVVTSIEKNNLPLIKLCIELDTRIFIGSENDVLDRYYQAAKLIRPEYVIRITADCPLFDWKYLDMAIEQLKPESDYMSDCTESFPDGLDIEIIKYEALAKSWKEANMSSEREHVTQYIRRHPELFVIQDLKCPIERIGEKRWTLDEEEDLEFITTVYTYFVKQKKKEDFSTKEILEYLENNPEVEKINNKFIRNEGLIKSIKEDVVVTNKWD